MINLLKRLVMSGALLGLLLVFPITLPILAAIGCGVATFLFVWGMLFPGFDSNGTGDTAKEVALRAGHLLM